MGLGKLTEDDWTELRAVYLGMCAKVDDEFARLVDGLKRNGTYDNTLIIVLSDHGDYCGDYSLSEKSQNTFEDCLVRVPLIIKPPKEEKVDPGITDSLAELVDFYRTVMDYAGVEPDHDQYGLSSDLFLRTGVSVSEIMSSQKADVCPMNGRLMNITALQAETVLSLSTAHIGRSRMYRPTEKPI